MQLTDYTDYSFRILIFLGLRKGELSTIREIAGRYGISRNHLVKVAHKLATLGYIRTARGKHGGIALALAPEQINIGTVTRHMEDNLSVVECFDACSSCCRIQQGCGLRGVMEEALAAFLTVLDRYTLADLLRNESELAALLQLRGTAHAYA